MDSGPRKGILKTKRITETSTIKISKAASVDDLLDRDTENTTVKTTDDVKPSDIIQDKMDWQTYEEVRKENTQTTVPSKPRKLFKLPPRSQENTDIKVQLKQKNALNQRRWRSEPSLVPEKQEPRSRSVDRLSTEKKLTNVKIDRIKPINLQPIKSAKSFGDLSSLKQNETKFHLKPQRWKSNPELTTPGRKHLKDFATKIVRALPVHLQPLHQLTPTSAKAPEVKDVSMQFTSSADMKTKSTQARLDPSPPLIPYADLAIKSTQTDKSYERISVKAPQTVEIHKEKDATQKEKAIKVKDLQAHDFIKYDKKDDDHSSSRKRPSDMIVVKYEKEPRRSKSAERMETVVCQDHSTEVKFRQEDEESKKKEQVYVGKIGDIEMESSSTSEVMVIFHCL